MHQGEKERATGRAASSTREVKAASSFLSRAGCSSLEENSVGARPPCTHTIFTVQALSRIKARYVDLPVKLSQASKT